MPHPDHITLAELESLGLGGAAYHDLLSSREAWARDVIASDPDVASELATWLEDGLSESLFIDGMIRDAVRCGTEFHDWNGSVVVAYY